MVEEEEEKEVHLRSQAVKSVEFKYLRSVVQNNGNYNHAQPHIQDFFQEGQSKLI